MPLQLLLVMTLQSDSCFERGVVTHSAFHLSCVHEFVAYFCWCCEECLLHMFVVCCWTMLCPVICVVGFFQLPIKMESVLLLVVVEPVEVHIHCFDGFRNIFIHNDAVCCEVVSLN